MNRRGALTGFFFLMMAALAGGPPARGETWPVLGFHGLWGYLGLGEEVEYSRQGASAEWSGGLTKSLNLSGLGYSLHPRFLTWQGNVLWNIGREMRVEQGTLRLDLLRYHAIPTSVVVQRTQEHEAREFLPERRALVDSLQVQTLVDAYRQPLFLNWSLTESSLDDPQHPRDLSVRSYSVSTSRHLHRDHDLSVRHEGLRTTDLLTKASLERESTVARVESRFWYGLVTLKSSFEKVNEVQDRDRTLTAVGEELTIRHSPDWTSRMVLHAEETSREDKVNTRVEAGGQTVGSLGPHWRLTLDGRGILKKESGGVVRRGLDAGARLGWSGLVGTYQVSASAGVGWRPEWGQGAYTFFVHREPVRLLPRTDPEAKPLANRRVILESVEVYPYPDDHTGRPLPETDYELEAIGEADGVAESVYVRRSLTSSYAGSEVRVNYSYLLPSGDTEQFTENGALSVSTTAGNLSLGAMANWTQIREYSTHQGDRTRFESGDSMQLGMTDGPFAVSASILNREGVSYRKSNLTYSRGRSTLSQTVERQVARELERRRGLTRWAFDLLRGDSVRVRGFTQFLTGASTGRQVTREQAWQTGVQVTTVPAPNLSASGSLSYLKDWANPTQDQALLSLRAEWWRGQLSVAFDAELEEDLGRDVARGKVRLLVLRRF